ncbi:tRNA pseudouridine(38-40) synthase TruA [Paenibacillus sp. ACRRX]|uniref:tRNA pseudouridine(38-40) synthase TruA n=1 Tax=Paenibacillus sp. ACRRX TaxID=2918206 RepID=UPI001EF70826|nr:tRNA pseudouridine(38-40) synthase TruA [Paenibacillus sp. ACRRX]MCG7410605.1 tRNA pseudouridine(38-40) synthase TruA [Paenibacillus sp. ACRRX]
MRNIGMTVAYDGTAYCGFQSQPELDTIQGRIEKAIAMLTEEHVVITASGRTDAGVHAQGQVFNFITTSAIPIERWALAMNSRLPRDIVIKDAWEAPMDFHARYSAKRKTYRYSILSERIPDLFQRHYEFHHPGRLQLEPMRAALKHLEGEHDFTSFASPKSTKQIHVRTIYQAWMEYEPSQSGEPGRGRYHLFVTGNGFLYNMVRIIAGTLLVVGRGKILPEAIPGILAACDRGAAGPTAMSHGLMLWSIDYGGEERL